MKDSSAQGYEQKHYEELAARARKAGGVVYSRFLTPAQMEDARRAAASQGVFCAGFGGYEEAERRVAAFSAEPLSEMPEETPIAWVTVHWDTRYGTVGHRDLLGALMALGLEREVFGDLVLKEEIGYVVVLSDLVPFVCEQLTTVGKLTVLVTRLLGQPDLPKPVYRVRHDTVASLRLDAVLAAAFHLSRSDAAEQVAAGLCKVDHRQVEQPDYRLEQGMLLSLRGKGRVRLGEIGGVNRKGRTAVTLLYND